MKHTIGHFVLSGKAIENMDFRDEKGEKVPQWEVDVSPEMMLQAGKTYVTMSLTKDKKTLVLAVEKKEGFSKREHLFTVEL